MRSFILPIGRPQYLVAPEVLLASLARRAYEPKFSFPETIGFTYKKNDGATASPRVHEFFPRGETVTVLAESLTKYGFSLSLDGQEQGKPIIAEAVSTNVLGTRSQRSKSQAAAPLTPGLALLQDLTGLLNKAGPADIGRILENIYILGAPVGYEGKTASERLVEAYDWRLSVDPVLSVIDSAVQEVMLQCKLSPAAPREKLQCAEWQTELDETPFRWFHHHWNEITSERWVKALPARVWVDWATTVLRLGLGMSYLWEASWTHAVAGVVRNAESEIQQIGDIKRLMTPPLPWEAHQLPPGMRNVSSLLKKRVKSAHAIRESLEFASKNHVATNNIPSTLKTLRSNPTLRESLTKAMSPSETTGKNTWEAISYVLTSRESVGDYVDYYGLLRRRGPSILEPDPGVEWIAVVASLTCGLDRKTCDVGEVLDNLHSLGARPKLRDLISQLEAAGLARGSADADRGVRVERAF